MVKIFQDIINEVNSSDVFNLESVSTNGDTIGTLPSMVVSYSCENIHEDRIKREQLATLFGSVPSIFEQYTIYGRVNGMVLVDVDIPYLTMRVGPSNNEKLEDFLNSINYVNILIVFSLTLESMKPYFKFAISKTHSYEDAVDIYMQDITNMLGSTDSEIHEDNEDYILSIYAGNSIIEFIDEQGGIG